MIKALRIHPSPFVTTGFLLAFVLLVGFLYGAPMITSQADDGDDTTRDDCDDLFFVEDCDPVDTTGRPTQTTPEPTTPPPATSPTAVSPTPPPTDPMNCGPIHSEPCFGPEPTPVSVTPPPTPPPTTPPPTTPPPTTTRPPTTTLPPIPNPFAAPSGLTGSANCNDATCDITLRWNSKSSVSQWTAHRQTGPSASDWTLVGHVSANTISESGLACGPTYRFRVYGLRNSASRDSVASPIYSFTSVPAECAEAPPTLEPTTTPPSTTPTAPPAPTIDEEDGLVAQNCTTTTCDMKITWTYDGNISGVNQFEIQRKTGSGEDANWVRVNHIASSSSEYTHTGQSCGNNYTYKVAAEGRGGNVYVNEWSVFTESSEVTATCGTTTPAPNPGTPSQTPAPTPEFTVSIKARDHFIDSNHDNDSDEKKIDVNATSPEWGVLAPFNLYITISRTDNQPISDSYEFRLQVDTEDTGLQIQYRGECSWTDPGSLPDRHKQTTWFSPRDPVDEITINDVVIVRCGKGEESNDGLTVRARDGSTGDGDQIFVIPNIKQAWHRTVPTVTYWISGSALDTNNNPVVNTFWDPIDGEDLGLFPIQRPSNLGAHQRPNPLLSNLTNYADAVDPWNDIADSSVMLTAVYSSSRAGVIVRGYWDHIVDQGDDKYCDGSIACTHPAPKTNPPNSNYPILADRQTLWIEDPPHWGDSDNNEMWTLDWSKSNNNPLDYQYFLTVLAHEFGHTIGLQHTADVDNIMRNAQRQLVLGNDDINGTKALYPDP